MDEFKRQMADIDPSHLIYGLAGTSFIHEGTLYNLDDLASGRLKEITSSETEECFC